MRFKKSEAIDRVVLISAVSESWDKMERARISVRAAVTEQSSRLVSSDVENEDDDGEKAFGAASRNVERSKGCS